LLQVIPGEVGESPTGEHHRLDRVAEL
jgi:hypothetical protein